MDLEASWLTMERPLGRTQLRVLRLRDVILRLHHRIAELDERDLIGDPRRIEEAMDDFEREILTFQEMRAAVMEALPYARVPW